MSALEPLPLLVAAAIGGAALWLIGPRLAGYPRSWRDFAAGAAVGVAVQLGVRVLGVS